MSVLVTPYAGLYYYELLYRDIGASGVRVKYAKGPTPSQTLNIVLGPAMLLWYRARGYRILHIHWLFLFSLPWARRRTWARHLMEWCFRLYLQTARLAGYAVVWTAHDLLPHEQVFANDARARDLLIAKSDAVIALSEATASELRGLGAAFIRMIPIGPYSDPYPINQTREEARASFGFSDGDVVMALIGRIEEYKGVDVLLSAAAHLPDASKIKVLVAGECLDQNYRARLIRLSGETEPRALLHLEFVPAEDLARYVQAADFAVFPFREISNSGSVLLAQSFGKPVIIPNLATLADIPQASAIRFEPGIEPLVAALLQAERLTANEYGEMSSAGHSWAHRLEWSEVAKETVETYRQACHCQPG